MRRVHYRFEVRIEIEFTLEEVKQLQDCARRHYDSTCKKAAEPGGILYNLEFYIEDGKYSREFTMRDLDLLCKITECLLIYDLQEEGRLALNNKLRSLFYEASQELSKLNAHLLKET